MVYGFRFVGGVYYSQWGFSTKEEAESRLEEIVKIFDKKGSCHKEIFEKKGHDMTTLKSYKEVGI